MASAASQTVYSNTLDILKGAGLLALVLVNCSHWYAAAALPASIYDLHKGLYDTIIQKFLDYFVSGQCYAFLAFVLGIQFFNASKRESRQQRPDYLRRYLILFLVGLAHQALWNGDVLATYALAGMMLVFLEKHGANLSLFLGLLFISNLPGFFISLFLQVLQGHAPEHSASLAISNADDMATIIEKGGVTDVFFFNIGHIVSKYKHLLLTGQYFRVTGFFIVGYYAGRINFIQQVKDNARFFGLVLMGCFSLFLVTLYMQLALYKHANPLILDPAKCMIDNLQHVFGSASYLIAGILFVQYEGLRRLVQPLGAVGNMWLTNYLLQTIAGVLLFYGIGFGLYPETGSLQNTVIGIAIFITQLLFSIIWMHYFYHGPMEWLWRSAAAYRWRKMRKRN